MFAIVPFYRRSSSFQTLSNTIKRNFRFLNRVALYNNDYYYKIEDESSESLDLPLDSSRKFKCSACTPKKDKPLQIPEERIPWEPEKKPVSKRRSRSVPAKKTRLPAIKEEHMPLRPKTTGGFDDKVTVKKDFSNRYTHKLFITKGCLKLCVQFPSDTSVKFKEGTSEKIISRGACCCKAKGYSKEYN